METSLYFPLSQLDIFSDNKVVLLNIYIVASHILLVFYIS
jgi:hypothetical protein